VDRVTDLRLVLGNKNYSSWSMRGWLAARLTGAPFEETVIPLYQEDTARAKADMCPAGRVPVLYDRDVSIWDSLAIGEYLAEKFPDAGLWPADAAGRATARSVCSEMHSQFVDLRNELPMNIRASSEAIAPTKATRADIERVTELWQSCRTNFGTSGPFLFGAWCLADIFYAPVVMRLRTYRVMLDDHAEAYARAVLEHEHVREWMAAANAESWSIPRYDIS
jgi:glutathione S-transferase